MFEHAHDGAEVCSVVFSRNAKVLLALLRSFDCSALCPVSKANSFEWLNTQLP